MFSCCLQELQFYKKSNINTFIVNNTISQLPSDEEAVLCTSYLQDSDNLMSSALHTSGTSSKQKTKSSRKMNLSIALDQQ